MYERILVALDGSPLAERVLPHVEALASRFQSTLVLLQVVPPVEAGMVGQVVLASGGTRGSQDLIAEQYREAAAYLDRVAGGLRARGISVEVQQSTGQAAKEIVERARREHIDLIAMTTHGRGGFRRLAFGSVAESVLHHAPCPVLVVRVDDSRSDSA